MKRSGFALRKPDDKARLSVPIKRRKCKACKTQFTTTSSFQAWCSPACALVIAQARIAKTKAVEARADRARTRAALESLKTLPMLKAEAQKEFNAFIRLRDAGRPCICCNYATGAIFGPGGVIDAGHYRSVGSAPHLRYDERNCHAQRKQCNRYGAGRAVDYRIGLINRIGLAAVEALESDQTERKYTRDELRAIRDEYRSRVRIMKKESS